MSKPPLDHNTTIEDFNDFYWLKKELIDFCKEIGISYSGGKIQIANRIRHYLSTGEIITKEKNKRNIKSKFDWDKENLTRSTVITDNYRNGENVRKFFIQEIGTTFRFNIIFMKWMKENKGKTLGDAVEEWKRINNLKKDKKYVSEIGPQFEYNRYMRAFLKDNPQMSSKDAMTYWKLKSSRRGTNEYERKDLELND